MIIKEVKKLSDDAEKVITEVFTKLAEDNGLRVNYTPFHFVAEENGEVIGVITGYAFYNEVYVSELGLAENARRKGIGSKLLQKVEEHFMGKCFQMITLNTYEFQALDFYKKNGYEVEYTRVNKTEPKLTRYFLKKSLSPKTFKNAER